jgi:hypothetical protein
MQPKSFIASKFLKKKTQNGITQNLQKRYKLTKGKYTSIKNYYFETLVFVIKFLPHNRLGVL